MAIQSNYELMKTMNKFYAKSAKYPAYNETQESEIMELLNRRVKSDIVRDNLWANMKNKHERAPMCRAINDLLNEAPDTFNQTHTPNRGIGMSAPQIYAEIQDIRDRQGKGEDVKNSDIDFLAAWAKIEYYWEALADQGKDMGVITRVCEKIRILIERSEEIPLLNTRDKVDLEAYIAVALKNKIVNSRRIA